MIEPCIGDVIFTRSSGWLARLTCGITGGKAAHQELIFRVAPEPMVLAADMGMGRMVTWSWEARKEYLAEQRAEWSRWSLKQPLELLQQTRVLHEAEEQVNTFKYSRGELVLQGIDELRELITGKTTQGPDGVWARRLGDLVQTGVICSKAGNMPLIKVGVLPDRACYWSPSDTLKHLDVLGGPWVLAEKTNGW